MNLKTSAAKIVNFRTGAQVQQSEEIALKEKFLSVVSHDLRTPLTVIKACADFVKRYPDNREIVEANTKRILKAIDRADALIRNMLDASRLQAGVSIQVNRVSCDLNALIMSIVEDYSLVSHGRCRFSESEGIKIYCDPQAIRRAIENLISNALKYGDHEGAVSVFFEEDDEQVKISVHNFGAPIPSEQIHHLFQWHGRAAYPQNLEEGWGLGLMIVKGIAEAHDGFVSVDSTKEKGTIFTLHLPR